MKTSKQTKHHEKTNKQPTVLDLRYKIEDSVLSAQLPYLEIIIWETSNTKETIEKHVFFKLQTYNLIEAWNSTPKAPKCDYINCSSSCGWVHMEYMQSISFNNKTTLFSEIECNLECCFNVREISRKRMAWGEVGSKCKHSHRKHKPGAICGFQSQRTKSLMGGGQRENWFHKYERE